MGARVYELNPPDYNTQDRLIEIQFQLFIENYIGKHSGVFSIILEHLCTMADVDYDEIIYFYEKIIGIILPSQERKHKAIYVAYMSYLGIIPQRTAMKITGVNSRLLTEERNDYIKNNQPGLMPVLTESELNIIKTFMRKMEELFSLTSYLVGGLSNGLDEH